METAPCEKIVSRILGDAKSGFVLAILELHYSEYRFRTRFRYLGVFITGTVAQSRWH